MKGNEIEIEIAYFYGRLEAQIESFANAHNLSWAELTERLAALILSAKSGQVLGATDRVPALRRQAPKVYKASRKVEVDGGSHRRAQVAGRKAGKTGWEKFDTPEKRSREVKRRFRIAKAKKKLREKAAAATA